MEFFPLVSKLEIDRPIYGLQARGTDGVEEPSNRVEDAALFFLDAIKHLQPRGPYLLVGYSLGGLITLEIARRLSENGETVALLVLMEAFLPGPCGEGRSGGVPATGRCYVLGDPTGRARRALRNASGS